MFLVMPPFPGLEVEPYIREAFDARQNCLDEGVIFVLGTEERILKKKQDYNGIIKRRITNDLLVKSCEKFCKTIFNINRKIGYK